MKETVCTIFGVVGAGLAWAFGGWDSALMALLMCMAIDYLSGSIVALVFHNSNKSETGSYNSTYGLKGLCKKGLMLLFVLVAVQIDGLLGADYVRDAVCIGFCSNEVLSIVENLGLAGVPMPEAVVKALEQLQKK
ncbi:MAG: phage holin family protein [Oscillospiraceae bacterium]|jgi:toxin secretion/phage lysis holin|nr:phage holin family protein [Oscillospiraceae bacterium]